MRIDEDTASAIGVALNEATLLGVEYDREWGAAAATFAVLTLPDDRSPEPSDPRRQILFTNVGASLQHCVKADGMTCWPYPYYLLSRIFSKSCSRLADCQYMDGSLLTITTGRSIIGRSARRLRSSGTAVRWRIGSHCFKRGASDTSIFGYGSRNS